MKTFINRKEELMLIETAIDTLLDRKRLLRTPIIEFYGVGGIGKTTLLRKVEEKCKNRQLPYVWSDMGQNSAEHFLMGTRKLLEENGCAVVILDSLDKANEEELSEIEIGLSDLIENSNLLVVLASRRMERFENIRTIARKLTLVHLKPFNRESCAAYLDSMERAISSEIRNVVYEWVRGYPLAMRLMIDALSNKNLDPDNEEDQRQLVSIITKSVVDGSLLSKVDDFIFYQTILSLLSIPRHFNLIIMQDFIEKFAPDYKLSSTLDYLTLPDKINKATNVLSWNIQQGGYCIDASIRNIFLLQLRITQPRLYQALHSFLAELNERFAKEVSGSDRVRYLREYFYHLANSDKASNLPSMLTQHLEQFIQ